MLFRSPGLPGGAGVYHYAPLHHTLEQRARWSQGAKPDAIGFYVGLTSVTWREAWKYGERAFRYCQHDVGHALAALRFAAASLGWRVQLLPEWDDAHLARLLGLDRGEDFADAAEAARHRRAARKSAAARYPGWPERSPAKCC